MLGLTKKRFRSVAELGKAEAQVKSLNVENMDSITLGRNSKQKQNTKQGFFYFHKSVSKEMFGAAPIWLNLICSALDFNSC